MGYADLLKQYRERIKGEQEALAPQEAADLAEAKKAEEQYQLAKGIGLTASQLGNIPTTWSIMKGREAPQVDYSQAAELVKPQIGRKDILAKYEALKGEGRKAMTAADVSEIERAGKQEDLALEQKYKKEIELGKKEKEATGEKWKQETALRGEITGLPVYKRTSEISDAYNKMIKSSSKPSPASDMTLVYQYMKMVDPGSTVREGEFANASNAAGVPEAIRAMYNKASSGEMLTEPMRADFLNQGKQLYLGQKEQFDSAASRYKAIAGKQGLDWENISPGLGGESSAPKKKEIASEDSKALEWAKNNPNDPRAKRILEINGGVPAR